jgi:hypothetical protein
MTINRLLAVRWMTGIALMGFCAVKAPSSAAGVKVEEK